MQKITKSRRTVKGISPIISVLLMIAIAVAASLVAYAWVSGYMDFTTTKVETSIQIQSVTEYAVYVQNIGESDVEVSDLYIDGQLELWASISVDGVSGQTMISPGQTVVISLASPLPRSGNQASIKIVTADGKSAEHIETFSSISNSPSTTYSVTFLPATGGSMNYAATTYSLGGPVTVSAFPEDNYMFDAWQSTGAITFLDEASASTTAYINSDGTITATFTLTSTEDYTVTITTVGGGTVNKTPDQATYSYGDPVELTAVPAPGWTFDGWSGDLTGFTNPRSITVTEDMSVTATFTQDQYTLTTNVIGNGDVNRNASSPYQYGDGVQLTAVPDEGWAFDGWSGDLIGSTNPDSITITGNMDVTATFTQILPDPLILLPVGTGDLNENWNNGGWSSSNWECVDDTTPDETYVYDSFQSSGYATDLYSIENHGSETGTINSVTVYIRARQDRSAGNTVQSTARIALKIGSTTCYGNEEYLTGSWTEYYVTFDTNPAGGTWGENWNTMDGMQIGVSLLSADTYDAGDGTCYAQCTQVWVEINYTP